MFPQGGVYIAGKMRGEPDCGFTKFFEAESWLLANTDFFPVFNPARRDVEITGSDFRGAEEVEGLNLGEAMEADLDFVRSDDCAAVLVLDDFMGSMGTLGEIEQAWTLNKPVYYLRRTSFGFAIWPFPKSRDGYWLTTMAG